MPMPLIKPRVLALLSIALMLWLEAGVDAQSPRLGEPETLPTPVISEVEDIDSPLPEPVVTETQPPQIAGTGEPRVAFDDDSKRILLSLANNKIRVLQFDSLSLAEAMKAFSEQTGLNVICSAAAGKIEVTVYLRNVDALAALEAIVKANGLFYRTDEQSGIVRIATAEEYEKDLTSFREEQTRIFTLLYPNPVAVAQVISQVFGDRVDLNMADADRDELQDLSQRFSRFDLVDGRALGLGTFDAGNSNNHSQLGRDPLSMTMQRGEALQNQSITNRSRSRVENVNNTRDSLRDLSAAQIQDYENQLAATGNISERDRTELMKRHKATIYVSTIRRNNQIIVRTGDPQSMTEIEQLIQQLDVPTPTVLLEVKVLRIRLADGFKSAFEYLGGSNSSAGAFSDGNLLPTFPGGNPASQAVADGLGLSGNVPGALTFQIVDRQFRYRMQLLESENRVTALATPLIMTANNEVSRIFVGDTLPFTIGFTPSQVVGGFNSVSGAVAATPITELRDVGQSLLITPNINADRTVTLRVVEENSERILGGGSIPIPDSSGAGVTLVKVDTVRRRTVSGTIVAHDGMAVALGGLIEETISDGKDQVPVLGNIPGLGFFFRRQEFNKSRSELVVVVRPYVFTTPSEAAATSQAVLSDLSIHPNSPDAIGSINTYLPCKVIHSESESQERAKLFQFHHVR